MTSPPDPPSQPEPTIRSRVHGFNLVFLEDAPGARTGVVIRYPATVEYAGQPFLDHDVTLDVDLRPGDHARLEVTRLEVKRRPGGAPVTSAVLRSIPVARLTRDAVYRLSGRASLDESDVPRPIDPLGTGPRAELDSTALKRATAAVRHDVANGRSRISTEDLTAVADAYRAAVDAGRPVQAAVAEALRVNRHTARRWIAEARRRVDPATGRPFLGAAPGSTRKGEVDR